MHSRYCRYIKKGMILLLAALLAASTAACGKSSGKDAERTTKAKQNNPDYVKEDVILPENFGNMIYPLEAVLVEDYSKELPYYTSDSPKDEADSFWFSMAVLTSQMNHYVKDVAVQKDDRYIYIDEETMNMYASGLYDEFGRGDLEFPDIGEDNVYAAFDDEKEIYGFREGTIGNLQPYITECKGKGDGFVFTIQLKDKESDEILSSAQINIVPSSYESDENVFHYSVKSFKKLDSEDMEDFSEKNTSDEKSTGKGEEESTEAAEEEDEEDDEWGSIGAKISKDEALDLAKDYYGEKANYAYQEIVTVGEEDYYDFSVEGDGIDSTDVLVSLDGEIVMGGTRNDDGSWSFDQ